MTRRWFVGLLASAAAGVRLVRGGTRFGYLDVDLAAARGHIPACVYLNGREVSHVTALNDIEGWVERYVTTEIAPGHFRGEPVPGHPSELRQERLHGVVRYVPNTVSQRPARIEGVTRL